MSMDCKFPGLLTALFLLSAALAAAATQAYPLRIRILSAETHPLNAEPQVPKDCDLQNFSAYCNESRNPSAQSVMLVQDGEGKSFRIACTTDSRWSKCSPLPVGETFEARTEKRGLAVLYRNAKGKETRQVYQMMAAGQEKQQGESVPAPVPAPSPPASSAQEAATEKIRCSFTSAPSGAEITIDGKYVGNTPSTIGVGTGTHEIAISMPGFAEWKRELTVGVDSVVNVTARLQKRKP
jgi:hypothetical protein